MTRARQGRWPAVILLVAGAAAPACHGPRAGCDGGPRVALVAPTGPVGFDAELSLQARPLCDDARAGTVTWRQLGVSPAAAPTSTSTNSGFALRARTPTLARAFGAPLPWGLVPLSPRTRGELLFEATWSDGHGHTERHEVRVAAAARIRGLPNMPLGVRGYLGGTGWRLDERPPGSVATLETSGGTTSLMPDVAGDWHLVDGGGRRLTLRTARYDETPLDCGRSGCHAAITAASANNPMTTVLARGIAPAPDGRGALFGDAYPDCALACHATGDPGVADGGFAHVMGQLGVDALGPRRWEAVPRPLRRLGGVGCLACHGPGALPEASARWSILRADVCATCHDAPPRYGHVVAWRATNMARADRDPRAAAGVSCARCHTTWGFVASVGAGNDAARVNRRPPVEVGPVGITCAACHAVHEPAVAARNAASPALLRTPPRPLALAGVTLPPRSERSRVCLSCHVPEPGEDAPSASAAALWLGRGGLDPATGAALTGPVPHANVPGGCIGCHGAGPAGVERGAGHAFVASGGSCASCHARGVPADDLRARAKALWTAWRARLRPVPDDDRPPHARAARLDRSTPLGRAAWDISLVLEDPAAAAHNAPYARLLLAAAERAFNGAGTLPAEGGRK